MSSIKNRINELKELKESGKWEPEDNHAVMSVATDRESMELVEKIIWGISILVVGCVLAKLILG